VQAEFLPPSVIARTEEADRVVHAVTETPGVLRNNTGRLIRGINGAIFPQPALDLAGDGSFTVDQGVQRKSASSGRCQAPCGALPECVRHRKRLPWVDEGSQRLHRRLHSPMGTELL
jgi:hypothetical protein